MSKIFDPLGEQKRAEIVDFVVLYSHEHGYPPSYREIAEAVDLHSTSAVSHHIKVLKHNGIVSVAPGTARTIKVIGR